MNDIPAVVIHQNYGGMVFRFGEIMDAKQINRNQLARRAGIRFEVADRFYHGHIDRMDMDVLARICYVLECGVGDVMEYHRP